MKKFEAKKQIKSKIYSKFTLLFLFFVILLLFKGVYVLYLRNNESASMRSDAEVRLNELKSRKNSLELQMQKLQSEEGVEEEIREKFNVVKPGEKVVIIIPDEPATTTPEKQGFFGTLWHKFFK